MGIRIRPAALWKFLEESIAEWNRDKALRLGAALSFYTVISLPPLLVVVVTLAALVFGREASQARLVGQFGGLIGEEGGRLIEAMLSGGAKPRKGTGRRGEPGVGPHRFRREPDRDGPGARGPPDSPLTAGAAPARYPPPKMLRVKYVSCSAELPVRDGHRGRGSGP